MPRKNLCPLVGKPLIAYSILSAQQTRSLHRFIVSTDDLEISSVAQQYGAEVPFLRPVELAQDDTPDLPVFQHAIDWLWEHERYRPDVIVHLRPTQPLRQAEDIDEVVRLLTESGADSVKSVRPVKEHPHKMWHIEEGLLLPYLRTEFRLRVGPDYPRQILDTIYVSTGVVDALWRRVIDEGSTTGNNIVPYITDPIKSLDLNTPDDFIVAEAIMGQHYLAR